MASGTAGLLLAASLGLGLAAPAGCPRAGIPPPAPETGNPDFEFVGLHPGARDQPTDVGRTIATLAAWEGRIYAGYGDISANTGPIAIAPFDPRTGAFVPEWTSDTEAIHTYRVIGGALYAAAADPREKADFAVGRPWRDERPVEAYHVFDVATLTGADRWLVGSEGLDAVAWRSADGGASWEVAQRVPPASGAGDDFARFHFAGVLGGRLYVQSRDYHRGPRPASRVFDGTAWSDGPDLLPEAADRGWHPAVFAGRMVYLSGDPVTAAAGARLLGFDGRQVVRLAAEPVRDFAVEGGRLFVLGVDGAVRRTSDLSASSSSWRRVAGAPPGARSLAVLDGRAYVGTSAAGVYRSRRSLD